MSTSSLARWPPARRGLRRALSRHRRLLAAGLTAAAVAAGLSVLAPPSPPTEPVIVTARDLAAGAVLRPEDVVERRLAPDTVPAGALRPGAALSGRVLPGPVRAGEPLTEVRLLGPSLLEGYGAGLVAAPVRIADAGSVRLLRVGDRIDVLAAETTSTSGASARGGGSSRVYSARVIADGAGIVSVPSESGEALGGGLGDGALVVLAVRPAVAADLARAAVTARLSFTLRPDRPEDAVPR